MPEPIANAIAFELETFTPIAVAAERSIAAACMAVPSLVRSRNRYSRSITIPDTARTKSW